MKNDVEVIAHRIDRVWVKLVCLVLLVGYAILPMFRQDVGYRYLGMACVAILGVLAGITLFRSKSTEAPNSRAEQGSKSETR